MGTLLFKVKRRPELAGKPVEGTREEWAMWRGTFQAWGFKWKGLVCEGMPRLEPLREKHSAGEPIGPGNDLRAFLSGP